jgi:hypothetical protein
VLTPNRAATAAVVGTDPAHVGRSVRKVVIPDAADRCIAISKRCRHGTRRTGLERSVTVGRSGRRGAVVVCDRDVSPLS